MGEAGNALKFNWEGPAKIVSTLLAIFTVFVGIRQYDGQDERQYRQKLYEERVHLYSELMDLSSRLAIASLDSVDTPAFRSLSLEFDRLYYGVMNMVQDTTVEKAMTRFKACKDLFTVFAPEVTPEVFRNSSMKLGTACRASLEQTQVVHLLSGSVKGE